VRVAVVFPRANRRAGVERVAWDLSDFLGALHTTAFVGLTMEQSEDNKAQFRAVRSARIVPSAIRFRRAAQEALEVFQPDVTLTLGAPCPPGDVYWVGSVHRAYLDRSPGPTVSGWQGPQWTRRLLPRHLIMLALERRYFRSAQPSVILCTSTQEITDLGANYGVSASRCRVMPNGYDPTIFTPERRRAQRERARADLSMSSDQISLLFVANELHRKGFGTLIEALAEVDSPGTRIDVVGHVSSGDYERRIEKLGLTQRIHWHGSTSDVFPFYAAADVLVLPTLYEPFGLVIMEALASGLPVITSRLAGAAPAVESSGSGRLLQDPTNVTELAGYLREAADPATRARWASGAPAAAAPYAWPGIFAQVEEVLQRAYEGKRLEQV
jgi:UDP-glucose:(heptosyl)LPS alpha-1,3-glucosyltransferase